MQNRHWYRRFRSPILALAEWIGSQHWLGPRVANQAGFRHPLVQLVYRSTRMAGFRLMQHSPEPCQGHSARTALTQIAHLPGALAGAGREARGGDVHLYRMGRGSPWSILSLAERRCLLEQSVSAIYKLPIQKWLVEPNQYPHTRHECANRAAK